MIDAYCLTPQIERSDNAFQIPICPPPPKPSRQIIKGGIPDTSSIEICRFLSDYDEVLFLFPPIDSLSKSRRYKLLPRPSRPLNRRPFKPMNRSIPSTSCPVFDEPTPLSVELQKFKSTIENKIGLQLSMPVQARPTSIKRNSLKKNTSFSSFANIASSPRNGSLNKVTSMGNLSALNPVENSLSRSSPMSRTNSCGSNLNHVEDNLCMTTRPSSCCLAV